MTTYQVRFNFQIPVNLLERLAAHVEHGKWSKFIREAIEEKLAKDTNFPNPEIRIL